MSADATSADQAPEPDAAASGQLPVRAGARDLTMNLQPSEATDRTSAPPPAAARAEHVEQAIRLENATGQSPQSEASLRTLAASPGSNAQSLDTQTHIAARAPVAEHLHLMQGDRADLSTFTSQTMRGLTALMNQRGGTMTMRLDPPELGALRVQMTIAHGTVSADFQASTPAAQALLDQHLPTLRNSLESQGLTVERMTVHTASSAPQGSAHAQQQSTSDDGSTNRRDGHAWSSQHDAGGSESRGRQERDAPRSFMSDSAAMPFSLLNDEFELASLAGGAQR